MYNISFPCVSNDESMRSSSLSPVFSKVGAAARPKSPPTLRRMYNDPPQPRTTVIYPFVYSDNSSKSIRDGRAGRLIDILFLFDVNVCCADSPLPAEGSVCCETGMLEIKRLLGTECLRDLHIPIYLHRACKLRAVLALSFDSTHVGLLVHW